MGRYSANTVDNARTLDVLYFQRNNLFSSGDSSIRQMTWVRYGEVISSIGYSLAGPLMFPNAIWLHYDTVGEPAGRSCNYEVGLTRTRCNYGGLRHWFICPVVRNGQHCNRRCRFLYLPGGSDFFGCRKCHGLTYRSQQKSGSHFYETVERLLKARWNREARFRGLSRRTEKRYLRLGTECSTHAKPKGMHWRTYRVLWLNQIAAETGLPLLQIAAGTGVPLLRDGRTSP